jgi:pentatricopeptide repeat protein
MLGRGGELDLAYDVFREMRQSHKVTTTNLYFEKVDNWTKTHSCFVTMMRVRCKTLHVCDSAGIVQQYRVINAADSV